MTIHKCTQHKMSSRNRRMQPPQLQRNPPRSQKSPAESNYPTPRIADYQGPRCSVASHAGLTALDCQNPANSTRESLRFFSQHLAIPLTYSLGWFGGACERDDLPYILRQAPPAQRESPQRGVYRS